MANKTLQARVQSKIDTSENWAKATNFVPLKGEICIYSDLQGQVKIGDGTSKIEDLSFSKETFIYTLTVNEAGVPTFSSDYATVLNVINKGFYDVRLRYTPANTNDFLYIPFTNKGTSWLDFSCTVDGILYEARLGAVDSSFRTQKLEPLVGSTEDTTPTQVKEALLEGRPVSISITDSTYGKLTFTNFAFGDTTGNLAANMVAMYNNKYLLYELLGMTSNDYWKSLTTTVASTDIATTSKDGLMSSADKTKLDGIAEGANKTIVDTELNLTSENPVQNKVVKNAIDHKINRTGGSFNGTLTYGGDTIGDVTALELRGASIKNVGELSFKYGSNTNNVCSMQGGLVPDAETPYLQLIGNNKSTTPVIVRNVNTPVQGKDAANKNYVDSKIPAPIIIDDALSDTSTNPVQNKIINSALNEKADKNHTHNYAGSSSAGGAANSANKLNTDAGSATNPVYFKDGVPVKTTYTLGKSVPSDAKFTDTVTKVDATLTAGGTNPVQGGAIKNYIDEKTAGLTGAMHYQGKATVDIADGSTTDPVISGYDFANKKAKGDVILGKDDHKEFVWNGSTWELLGDEGSYALNTAVVHKAGEETITGHKTFNAPANVANTEQETVKFKTSNGGALVIGKEGGNSGTMMRFEQTEGTTRLKFRSSATAGAMVWEQPEKGAQLFFDLGKSGDDYRRISLPSSAGTIATTANIATEIGKLDANEVGGTGKYIQSVKQVNGKISATAGTMPTTLKNPNALTFTGAVTGTYDGSAAKTVNIPAAITVDSSLSNTSTNPVQNKVIKTELNTLQQRIESVNDYAKEISNRIPAATTANNGQFLRVVNGVPTWVALTNVAEEGA